MSIIERLEAAGEVLSPAVRAAIQGLEATVAMQQERVREFEERVRELEARLGLNSTNSSKPPSSDPPGVVRPPKKPTGKKRGGQKGHRGHHRKCTEADRVDVIVEHRPEACRHCGHGLAGAEEAKPAWVHQVTELPPIRAEVTEHRMHSVRCPKCSKVTRACLPAEVGRKHFGPRLVGLGSLLSGRYRMSRREIVDLLSRLLDVPAPSLGSTEAFTQEASTALKPAYEQARAAVLRSDAAGVDETPWKLGGKKQWLWVATASSATVFHLGPGRGAEELKRFLGEKFRGVVGSDRWCAYQIYERRQLCWAHLLRNFKKLALRGGQAVEFAEEGVRECARVFALWSQVQEGQIDREQLRRGTQRIRNRFRRLVRRGAESADKRVAGFSRNLLRLQRWLWTFVEEPVEPTNNAAERALRPAVLWRKGCFGNQSETGMRYVERVLTFTATCRQQQVDPVDFLTTAIFALRSGTMGPTLVATH
jgi:transposase